MGFRALDVNVSGKHADLIRDGKYEIYSADWLRSTIRMLMNEAYEYGMQNVFPYDKEMEKTCGDGWKKLHEEINERIDTMLEIGVRHVKETHTKGTKSNLSVVDERAWDPGRPLTIDEAHYYYK